MQLDTAVRRGEAVHFGGARTGTANQSGLLAPGRNFGGALYQYLRGTTRKLVPVPGIHHSFGGFAINTVKVAHAVNHIIRA